MKVITKDFQILKGENEFVFNPGINVIVGSNASGKSSLFYAIDNCLSNPNGVGDCINYDARQTSVTIEDQGESITWVRTPDSSTYINNVTNYKAIKASKLDSRDFANLGFHFDHKGNVVNIHNEWSVLFPFGESDSEMFRLFEDMFNISSSFEVMDEIKKDEQTLKQTLNSLTSDKELTNNKLIILNEIKEKVNSKQLFYHIEVLKNIEQQKSNIEEDYNRYSKASLLKDVVLPLTFDLSVLYQAQYNYESIKNDYQLYLDILNKSVVDLPSIEITLPDNSLLTNITNDYEQYCITLAGIEENTLELQKLNEEITNIQTKINSIKVCPTCGRPLTSKE